MTELFSPAAFEAALRRIGAERYHNLHPFHRMLHGGACTLDQVRAWALNRYYYQSMIPIKDAVLLSRMDDAELRREWRSRIFDHDGQAPGDGGIAKWLLLTSGLGLAEPLVTSARAILPATRFAVEAYVNFCRHKTLLEGIGSSLTELFSPAVIGERIEGMLAHYPFITAETMSYFTARPPLAKRDSEFALQYVKEHAQSRPEQEAVLDALRFKCDVLWAQLDGLMHAYVEGHVPPGAWNPGEAA